MLELCVAVCFLVRKLPNNYIIMIFVERCMVSFVLMFYECEYFIRSYIYIASPSTKELQLKCSATLEL
jgi:hypothetical protein